MASSSSRTSSATKEYDVFISFRGEDTRHSFTSHLYSALSRSSIKAYIDYELKKGDDISPTLIQAIQDSYGSLVVFSENYASSKWCLNELLEILECRKQGQFVIPVFYKVDPSHVRKQTAGYAEAFAKHTQDSNSSEEKLQKWKVALYEAADIAGWDSESRTNRDESELIQNIVEDVLQKMDHIYQPSQLGLVGIEKRCGRIESLLQEFPVVGIWGIGGIGKTTIAKAIFDKLCSQFDSCCFIENVREESQRSGLNDLRDKLLFELLKDEINPFNPHKPIGFKYAMRRLSNRKVLIVLDDVNSYRELEYLVKECNFSAPGSRTIITTRDRHLLTCLRVEHAIYDVEKLNFEESLELFRLNAFNENYLEIGNEDITKKIINYSEGTPLVLKVLGSFLLTKSREEWESAWKKLKKIPDEEIQKVLRLSFDGLNHEEQQIFLDIACFLKGWEKERVVSLLDDFYGVIGIRTLQDRALITISNHNMVQMHDLIQEMGCEIVREESIKEYGRRSRLCDFEEVYDVLKYNKGTEAVEGIILDMSQIRELHLSTDTFKKMPNLRFLSIYASRYLESCKIHLPVKIQSFSDKLRYLEWQKYPLRSLPSTICVEKLVELHMQESHITKLWKGVQDLVNLKSFNLRGSQNLIELPDLSRASNLKWVDLSYCTSLCRIHPSILSLHTLESLNLTWCKKLKNLHCEVHLKSLDIIACSSLKEFSLTSEEIRLLNIEGTAIEILHSSIGRCSNLETLNLRDSVKILPNDLSRLRSLKSLSLRNCRELNTQNLHVVLDGLLSLEDLYLSGCCNLSQLPNNIAHLSGLAKLYVLNCLRLSYIPELPSSIETLNVTNCRSLETIFTPKPLECKKSCFLLKNCVKLGEDHLSAISECANSRIKQAALCKFGSVWNNSYSHDVILPGNRVPSWFKYQTRQNRISIEIPPCSHLLGFSFCCILSPEFLPNQGKYLSQCGCYCYLEGDRFTNRFDFFEYEYDTELMSDHVFIWYNPLNCYQLFDAMKEQRAKGQSTKRLSFEFYVSADGGIDSRMENAIKECGVWPIYASEYDNSINELELKLGIKLGYRSHDIDEKTQFFDPTSENLKPSLLPMELEFDELGTTQDARQNLPEINSSYLLNRSGELDYSTSQMEGSLESGLGNRGKRCKGMDENQQLQRKKSNRCMEIDEVEPRTNVNGAGGSAFDHQNKDEQPSLLQTKELTQSVFQPLPPHISTQNDTDYLSQKFSCGCLMGLLWKCLWRFFST